MLSLVPLGRLAVMFRAKSVPVGRFLITLRAKISTGLRLRGSLAATMRAESVPVADFALVCDRTARCGGPVASLLSLVPLGSLSGMG